MNSPRDDIRDLGSDGPFHPFASPELLELGLRIARRLTKGEATGIRDPEAAYDLLHEFLYTVGKSGPVRSLAEYDGSTEWIEIAARFMGKVMRNILVDEARRRRSHKRRFEAVPLDEVVVIAKQPEYSDWSHILMETVSHLDAGDQMLLRFRMSGMAWKDISAVFGTSNHTVRQRWSRLMKQLRNQIVHRSLWEDVEHE